MRSKNAIKNIITSLILQVVTVIFGFIIPKMIIENYGSNVNGLISSITQFLAYITLLESGIGPVIKSQLYKPISQKDNSQIVNILYASKKFFNRIALIFVTYIAFLCLFYPTFVPEFGGLYTASLIVIIGISSFSQYYFGITYEIFLEANQKGYIATIFQIITTIANSVVIIVLVLLKVEIHYVKLISAVFFIIRPLLLNLYVRKKYKIDYKKSDKNYKLKNKWDGLAQHIATVVHNNTDIVVLSIFANLLEVSVYYVYNIVITGIGKVVNSLIIGIDSSFGDMLAKGEEKNIKHKFRLYETIYFSIMSAIFICTITLILPFIQVYTKNVTDVNYIRPYFAYIIILAEFVRYIRFPYSSLVNAGGYFKETRKGAILEAALNIIISVLLVIKLGIVGVAIGTLIATIIRSIEFIVFTSKRILKRKCIDAFKHILFTILEIGLGTLVAFLIKQNFTIDSYLSFFVVALIIFAFSTVYVILTKYLLFNKELKEIMEIFKKVLNIKRKKKIYVILGGGLGNQMFKYAFARNISLKYNCECFLDKSGLTFKGHEIYALDHCNISEDVVVLDNKKGIMKKAMNLINKWYLSPKNFADSKQREINERRLVKLQPIMNFFGLYFLPSGYYNYKKIRRTNNFFNIGGQCKKFFIENEKIIKNELKIIDELSNKNKEIYNDIEISNAVCMHVRRGDYVNSNFEVCNIDYFNNAVKIINEKVENPKYFIFSDDIEFVKNNINLKDNFVFIDEKDQFQSLKLMYSCKHFIMSNSTYSYMAQFLSDNDEKIVIAPKKWRTDLKQEDIYDDTWIKI